MHGSIVGLLVSCSVVNVAVEALSRNSFGSSLRTDDSSKREDTDHWFLFDPIQAIKDNVDKMRGEMCWLRGEILDHDDCMDWLVPKCRDDEFGVDYCERLKNHVREECLDGNAKACDYAKKLGLNIQQKNAEEKADVQATPPDSIAAPSPAVAPAESSVAPPAVAPAETTVAPEVAPPAPAAPATTVETETTTSSNEVKTTAETTALPKATAAPKTTTADEDDEALIPALETTTKASSHSGSGALPGGYQEARPGDKLQSQGFSGKKVRHEDGQTYAADWQNEYGHPEEKHEHSKAWSANGLALAFVLLSMAAVAS